MQIHHTKGIVLRSVKYGETSIIATVYTELFGVQSYIVKGVRQSSKKSQGKANYFQPAAVLDMQVYHNEFKNLQFIKEYQWSFLYKTVLFDVVKNAVAMFMIELLLHSIKQPENNPDLFYFIENSLQQLDDNDESFTANLPLYFILHLGSELGFKIQGEYSRTTAVLDLQEGFFVDESPLHHYHIANELAAITSQILSVKTIADIKKNQLNKNIRRQLLQSYQQYFALHITDFGELKSLTVLQEVLS
jgi:DNA repair protein RecO (recombination protein O)